MSFIHDRIPPELHPPLRIYPWSWKEQNKNIGQRFESPAKWQVDTFLWNRIYLWENYLLFYIREIILLALLFFKLTESRSRFKKVTKFLSSSKVVSYRFRLARFAHSCNICSSFCIRLQKPSGTSAQDDELNRSCPRIRQNTFLLNIILA